MHVHEHTAAERLANPCFTTCKCTQCKWPSPPVQQLLTPPRPRPGHAAHTHAHKLWFIQLSAFKSTFQVCPLHLLHTKATDGELKISVTVSAWTPVAVSLLLCAFIPNILICYCFDAVSLSMIGSKDKLQIRVFFDPGHGGQCPACCGCFPAPTHLSEMISSSSAESWKRPIVLLDQVCWGRETFQRYAKSQVHPLL